MAPTNSAPKLASQKTPHHVCVVVTMAATALLGVGQLWLRFGCWWCCSWCWFCPFQSFAYVLHNFSTACTVLLEWFNTLLLNHLCKGFQGGHGCASYARLLSQQSPFWILRVWEIRTFQFHVNEVFQRYVTGYRFQRSLVCSIASPVLKSTYCNLRKPEQTTLVIKAKSGNWKKMATRANRYRHGTPPSIGTDLFPWDAGATRGKKRW